MILEFLINKLNSTKPNKVELSNERVLTEIDNLRSQISLSRIYGFIMTCLCIGLSILYMQNYNTNQDNVDNLQNILNVITDESEYFEERCNSMSETIVSLNNILLDMDEQNKSLIDSNQKYYEENQHYKQRAELYDKYEYAIIDESNQRTDITYDQLISLEDMVNDSNIKDEDLILAIVMTESNGNEKARNIESTAKGYGQILDGTSKFVYTKLLGNTNWNSNIALDGNTNLQMMVAYLDYLYDFTNANLYNMIRHYRGKEDISGYVNRIDSFLNQKDKSVQLLASTLIK